MIYSFFSNAFYYSGLSWIIKQMKINEGKYVLMFHGVSKIEYQNILRKFNPTLIQNNLKKYYCG